MNAEREPAQEAVFGSPEWTAAFMDAVKQLYQRLLRNTSVQAVLCTSRMMKVISASCRQTERSASSSARKLISSSPSQILPDH